jgi:predicted metal-dependent hydrolase
MMTGQSRISAVMAAVLIDTIRIEVEHKRVKTMRITVYPPDGRVKITAPLSAGSQMIRDFVLDRRDWIKKHQARLAGPAKESRSFLDGEIHYVWGEPYSLEVIEKRGQPKIEAANNRLIMYVRPGTERQKKRELFDKWRRGLIQQAAPRLVAKWEPILAVKIKEIFYRKMKTHWGSCNYGRKTIRLNTELVKKKPKYLEYVIVHEMLHIIEPNHSGNFYRLLGKYYPEWKAIRKEMNR